MNDASRPYDPVAKALHWLIAFGVIGMLAVGWIMSDLPNSPEKFALFQWHKSIGITIMLLALLRLFWRMRHPPPPYPPMKPWERGTAHATHGLLYLLIIAMPFLGWMIVSASPLNIPTLLYGLIPWPHMPIISGLENKKAVSEWAAEMHELMAWGFVVLIALHIAGAFKHHWINRDAVLIRMAPRFTAGFLNRLRGQK